MSGAHEARNFFRLAILTAPPYPKGMTVTITAKGQITLPLRLREKFHLNVGDQIEFDESAPVLTARRVVNRGEWKKAVGEWQKSTVKNLKGHPWQKKTSAAIVDDLRGGPAETTRKRK